MPIKNVKPPAVTRSITATKESKQLSQKKSREALQHEPPEKLSKLIELVNGLLPDYRSWEEMEKAAKELEGTPLREFGRDLLVFGNKDQDRPIMEIEAEVMIFRDAIEELRGAARDYVGPLNLETALSLVLLKEPQSWKEFKVEETMLAARIRYDRLVRARKLLEEIAKHSRLIKSYKSFYSQTGEWPAHTTLLTTLFSSIDVSLHVNEQGRIAIRPNELLDAVLGADAERIRQCPICKSIFWARRIDQKACSKRCSNILRVRRSRELHQERGAMYKRARIKKANMKKGVMKDSKLLTRKRNQSNRSKEGKINA